MKFGWTAGDDRHTLGAEELSRDVEGLAADDNDLLAAEKLLGDNGGETAKEVALAVNDNLERFMVSIRCPLAYCMHIHFVSRPIMNRSLCRAKEKRRSSSRASMSSSDCHQREQIKSKS